MRSLVRKWVSVATLLAFVTVNGSVCAHSSLPFHRCDCNPIQDVAASETTCDDAGCPHCGSPETAMHSAATAMTDSQGDPASCPHDDGCPCRDGCIYCGISKLLVERVFTADLADCRLTDRATFESTLVYLPPVASGLIRPPRA